MYFEWLVTEKLDNEVIHHYLPLVAFILAGCTDKLIYPDEYISIKVY
jgi:hypothetical protein